MKVTQEQFINGVATYIAREVAPQYQGLLKYGVSATGTAYASLKLAEMMTQKADDLKMLGYMTEDGMIDADLIHEHYKRAAEELGPVKQTFPILGPITFDVKDIDSLYHYVITP